MRVLLSSSGLLLSLCGLVGVAAFFSAAEIGILSINRYRLRHLARKKKQGALRVMRLLEHPDRLFGVLLTGSTLANILASMVATVLGERLGGNLGIAIATVSLSFVILVLAEMVPKTLAAMFPLPFAFVTSFFLKGLDKIFYPIVFVISNVTKGVLRLFRISVSQLAQEALTTDELRSVVSAAESFLPSEHQRMLMGLLDLDQATVEDVMIPIAEVTGIDANKPWEDILSALETAQHTRLPIYRDDFEEVLGVLHVREALHLVMEDSLSLEQLVASADTPLYTLEGTSLHLQMLNFRREKKRSAFVVDEYGELKGLVTLEDILEEIVGEFTTDISDLGKDLLWQSDGSVIVDASLTMKQLVRILGWNFPLLGPKTLSGLIIEHLGYIPPAACCLKLENFYIEILKVGENMIKMVRIQRSPPKQVASRNETDIII